MNPFIPEKKPRYVIIDYRASKEVIEFFDKKGIKSIKTCPCLELQEPVNGHPDMVMHPVDERTFVVAPNVFNYYAAQLTCIGIKVIKGGKTLHRNYPDDIAYNVARIGRYAVHNMRYTDEVLRCCLEAVKTEFIHVSQGYAKCSIAPLDSNKAVTSDEGVHRILRLNGIECLCMNPGIVRLDGYDYGFIGGAVFILEPGIFVLSGRIKDQSEDERLRAFTKTSGYKYVEASKEEISDLGTVIPVI